MTSLSTIAPKLGKLIPLLSSDKAGEVTATVAAIDRTLKSAGLSWHDLAERIASTPAPFVYKPTAADAYSYPAPPQPAPKPKRAPNPWPTFGTLKHNQRCAWLEEMNKRSHAMERKAYAKFFALKQKMITRPHEVLSRKEITQFNLLVKMLWFMGARP